MQRRQWCDLLAMLSARVSLYESPYSSDDYEGGGKDRTGVDCFLPRGFGELRTRIYRSRSNRSDGDNGDGNVSAHDDGDGDGLSSDGASDED
jgi:hypothetical protein